MLAFFQRWHLLMRNYISTVPNRILSVDLPCFFQLYSIVDPPMQNRPAQRARNSAVEFDGVRARATSIKNLHFIYEAAINKNVRAGGSFAASVFGKHFDVTPQHFRTRGRE
jgi:hypothetical protein